MENVWPQSFDKIGGTQKNKDRKDPSSAPSESTQDGDQQTDSDTCGKLDTALASALNLMHVNIIKVVDEKLTPLAESIHNRSVELPSVSKQIVKQRLAY